MSRKLDDLAPEFRPLACELIARCAEAGIAVMIIYTRRTQAEQDALIAGGRSWTTHSRHLTGHAIDICPYEEYELVGPDKLQWNGSDPVWQRIGNIGKGLGLVWGGDWTQRDLGHFEKV